ncbi:hypothetical protein BSPLISOX_203 [uncultured Gammaproteobacteria bacterium]|jgi:hypothetical protein|nr:hypothetical protein [uncultured Gammaproteobacteria bacterium]CAC9457138.1 hypothetical protein [uncultured Gammaproteobacteria bacterium]CAC9465369.1 hypothetical protein [uncultured Gammaproteobacteria bacterium]VVH65441.1 hypothetical protein BSPLISOX_203 [uncultured Gammaproteobacteria bacterium]
MSQLDVNFKRDFIEALDNIVCRLGQGAKICNCNADDRFIFACVEFVEEEIINNTNDIFTAVHGKIDRYINDFSVAPKVSIDEHKTYFFIFHTLHERLSKNNEDKKIVQIILYTMVYIFDDLLNLVNARRQALNERVCQMIKNGTLFKKTGDIGLYLTYKCLYNSAKDNQKN